MRKPSPRQMAFDALHNTLCAYTGQAALAQSPRQQQALRDVLDALEQYTLQTLDAVESELCRTS